MRQLVEGWDTALLVSRVEIAAETARRAGLTFCLVTEDTRRALSPEVLRALFRAAVDRGPCSFSDPERGPVHPVNPRPHRRECVREPEPSVVVSVPVQLDVRRPHLRERLPREPDQRHDPVRIRVPDRVAEAQPRRPPIDRRAEERAQDLGRRARRRVLRDQTSRREPGPPRRLRRDLHPRHRGAPYPTPPRRAAASASSRRRRTPRSASPPAGSPRRPRSRPRPPSAPPPAAAGRACRGSRSRARARSRPAPRARSPPAARARPCRRRSRPSRRGAAASRRAMGPGRRGSAALRAASRRRRAPSPPAAPPCRSSRAFPPRAPFPSSRPLGASSHLAGALTWREPSSGGSRALARDELRLRRRAPPLENRPERAEEPGGEVPERREPA